METHGLLMQSSSKFLNALIENKSIQEIVDIGYEFLGNPMFVIDVCYKRIACTKYVDVEDPEWCKSIDNDYLPYDILIENNSEMKEFFRKVRINGNPIIIKPKNKNFQILYAAIVKENKTIGYLVIPFHKKLFNQEEIKIATLLSNVLSVKVEKSELFHNSQGHRYEYFIEDLLNGNIIDPEIIQERLKCINWILQDNIYVVTFQKKKNCNKSLLNICKLASNQIYGSKAIVYRNYVVLVISRKKNDFPNENDLKYLTELLQDNEFYGGISRCFHNLLDICKYFKQSLKAIELGVRINEGKNLFDYEQYSIYHLMSIFSIYENLKDFCHPYIFDLLEYDCRYKDQLTETLQAYLTHNKSVEKASNAMRIHRNTMAFRIKKIAEIINVDMHNDDILFHLFFSLKVLKFMNSTKLD